MKIAIDLGHGVGQDRGAVGTIAEETIINTVGNLVINKLKELGHTVVEVRPSSAASVCNSLYQRYIKSDRNNCNWCISIHANAGAGVGTEVFTYGAKEIPEARQILNGICALGFTNRGIKDGSHLAIVRRPKAKAMLIEVCFVDSTDVERYTSIGAEAIANAIVQGLTGQAVNDYGWQPSPSGYWYKREDGSYPKDRWEFIKDTYYNFDSDGYMRTGWLKDNGYWFYLKSWGGMAHNEWLWIDGECYYFGDKGGMYVNCTTPDGYKVDYSGAWVQ